MGFINTLNHVTHGSIRVKIIDDHTRDSAVYSLIEMWDRYDPDTLMDLVDNDPDEMPMFDAAYARYTYVNYLVHPFNTIKPTFLNTAKERR